MPDRITYRSGSVFAVAEIEKDGEVWRPADMRHPCPIERQRDSMRIEFGPILTRPQVIAESATTSAGLVELGLRTEARRFMAPDVHLMWFTLPRW